MNTSTLVGFIGPLFAMALYGALHSWLASRSAKEWARRAFGPPADRFYRLAYNVVAVITLLPVLALPALYPGRTLYTIRPPWLWVTLLLQVMAGVIILVGLAQTGIGNFLGLSQAVGSTTGDEELVVKGLYRWVRHPLYSAGLVLIWLLPIMTTSLLALNVGFSAYLYIGSIYEERKLVAEFGERYQRYQHQVPRLLPRPWQRYTHDS